MIAPPPAPFPAVADAQIEELTPGSLTLHRTHNRAFGGRQFNPCLGAPSRFAPIRAVGGNCIPSLYAGESFDCAAFESVFHDVPMSAVVKTVREQRVLDSAHSTLTLAAPLRLVKLYAPDLRRWQLSRADLIDTPAADYLQTAPWAKAIHGARTDAQGLVWTSRRFDPARAVVLFGDRIATSALQVASTRLADRGLPLYADLQALAARYNITITL